MDQLELAQAIGVSFATYRRLEAVELDPGPRLAHLVNCAIVLDVPLATLLEDDYLGWKQLSSEGPAEPPADPQRLWRARPRRPQLPPA